MLPERPRPPHLKQVSGFSGFIPAKIDLPWGASRLAQVEIVQAIPVNIGKGDAGAKLGMLCGEQRLPGEVIKRTLPMMNAVQLIDRHKQGIDFLRRLLFLRFAGWLGDREPPVRL